MNKQTTVNLPVDLRGAIFYTAQDDMQHPFCTVCPHCGYVEYAALSNEWENLDGGEDEWEWTCEGCNQDYILKVNYKVTLAISFAATLPYLPPFVTEGA